MFHTLYDVFYMINQPYPGCAKLSTFILSGTCLVNLSCCARKKQSQYHPGHVFLIECKALGLR